MKNFTLLTITVILLSLISCSGPKKEDNKETQTGQKSEQIKKEKKEKHTHLKEPEKVAKKFLEAYKEKNYQEITKYVTPNQKTYYSEKNPDIDKWVKDEFIGELKNWDGNFKEMRYTKNPRNGNKQIVYLIKEMKKENQDRSKMLTMVVEHYQDDYNYKKPVWIVTSYSGLMDIKKEKYNSFSKESKET